MTAEPPLKSVIWVGCSRKDLREFPEPVQGHMGYALFIAQQGSKFQDTKTLSGFGSAGVVEIIKDYRSDTFRAVYTVRFRERSMCFTHSKRSRRQAEKRRRQTLTLSRNGFVRLNG